MSVRQVDPVNSNAIYISSIQQHPVTSSSQVAPTYNLVNLVWRYLDTIDPRVGDVILLKKANVHGFDGGSLNAYESTEILLNSERSDCVAMREWWEVKQLEENGCLHDMDMDLDI